MMKKGIIIWCNVYAQSEECKT